MRCVGRVPTSMAFASHFTGSCRRLILIVLLLREDDLTATERSTDRFGLLSDNMSSSAIPMSFGRAASVSSRDVPPRRSGFCCLTTLRFSNGRGRLWRRWLVLFTEMCRFRERVSRYNAPASRLVTWTATWRNSPANMSSRGTGQLSSFGRFWIPSRTSSSGCERRIQSRWLRLPDAFLKR